VDIVYRIVSNFLHSAFILILYGKIISGKVITPNCLVVISISFAAYMTASHRYIPEPLRTTLGIILLGLLLWAWRKRPNWTGLVLAFLCGYVAWIISAFITATICSIILETTEESIVETLISLITQFASYLAAYKLVRIKNGIPYINEIEIKIIVFSATGTLLSVWGIHHLHFNRTREVNLPLFATGIAALAFVALGSGLLIVYLTRRHREKLDLEKRQRMLEEENQSLEDLQQKYRTLVPVMGAFSGELLEQLAQGKVGDDVASTDQINSRISTLNQMAMEISEEFAIDRLDILTNSFQLPETWRPLQMVIQKSLAECYQKDIDTFIQNRTNQWEALSVSKTKFIRLVGNVLSNALKELDKTESNNKQILIKFFDDDGAFVFEVLDTAHAFSIDILVKLGQRGNSTNGTGNGYAEIFAFLAESKASLVISEWVKSTCHVKTVSVVFDDKTQVVVKSAYRYDELKIALKGSVFEVERLG